MLIIKDEAIKGNQIDYSTAAAMACFRAVGLEGTLQGSSIRLLEGETQTDGIIRPAAKIACRLTADVNGIRHMAQ